MPLHAEEVCFINTNIAFTIGPLSVAWYGILIAFAFALGSFLAYREAKRQHLNIDDLFNLLLLIIVSAIIGARFYYVIMRWDYYSQFPAHIFQPWRGGLAIHGGIIFAVLAILVYCRKRRLNFLRWADIFAPSLVLGQAIGRWGNFINQEAYGIETTVPWAMWINGAYRHPTFLYESILSLLVFGLLLWLNRRPHRIGSIAATYFIFHSIGRFFIEMLRTDSLMLGPWRVAMLVAAIFVMLGALILYRIRQEPLVNVAELPPPARKQKNSRKPNSRQKGR